MPERQGNRYGGSSIDEYELSRTLGEGSFGKVRLARHRLTQEYVAIKIMNKERILECEEIRRVTREVAILKTISHPNVVKLYEIMEDETSIFLVMEYIETTLLDIIQQAEKLGEGEAARILFQIITGIQYIHSLGIAHRDLKPNNILVTTGGVVKIADFGLSNMYKIGTTLESSVGSSCYVAPEIIEGKMYNPMKIDVWSFGVTMYASLTGQLPFVHENIREIYKMILAGEYHIPREMSIVARDLLKNILVKETEKRYSIKDIKTHPWMYLHTKDSESAPVSDTPDKSDLIMKVLMKQGYEQEEIQKDLKNKKHNKVTTLYHLYMRKGEEELQELLVNGKKADINRVATQESESLQRKKFTRKHMINFVSPRSKRVPSKDKSSHSRETYIKIKANANSASSIKSIDTIRNQRFIPLSKITSNISATRAQSNPSRKPIISKNSGDFKLPVYRIVHNSSFDRLRSLLIQFLRFKKIKVTEHPQNRFQFCHQGQRTQFTINKSTQTKNMFTLIFTNWRDSGMLEELFDFIK